jgi:hypothetical protein
LVTFVSFCEEIRFWGIMTEPNKPTLQEVTEKTEKGVGLMHVSVLSVASCKRIGIRAVA